MQLHGILDPNIMDLNLEAETKEEVIFKLADLLLKEERITDAEQYCADVLSREETVPTDVGIGVAIPHAKSAAVSKNAVAFARLKTPIPWNGEQQSEEPPVHSVFLLAVSSKGQENTHLQIIAKIAELLLDDAFLSALQSINHKEDLIDTMKHFLGEA
ncbi:MAG: PTS sugar transporter subunit IIA [Anaerolineaceae bacterium]|nr:PTS sugar transporter subunit IIA [Anaerolineaceae bacterium]